jgi:RecA/RadA recombinase
MERRKQESLSKQMKTKITNEEKQIEKPEYDGDFGTVISTGSTLLDLAISGGRVRGGGLPGGILVECFGPSSSGKSVLLSEIAGNVQKQKGEIMFHDPEASLDTQFALMFGLSINKDKNYFRPDTVTEVFASIRNWNPGWEEISNMKEIKGPSKDRKGINPPQIINGIFTDSLAALSTSMEMDNDEGDPFGGRRAKEFSEGLRKTCRIIKDKNYLMVCSNQVRDVIGATMYQAKTKSPGGKALEFYPSLRLEFSSPRKIKLEKQIVGKKQERIIGVETTINVFKSKIWKPFRSATISAPF